MIRKGLRQAPDGGNVAITSGELITCVAGALGMARETVAIHFRHLREGGMVSQKGRGRGAASMTSLDAARLIIAVAGSFAVKDSVATVAAFGPLLPPRVSAGLCFEDMLARLIDKLAAWAAEGQLPGLYLGLRGSVAKQGAPAVELVSGVGTDLKNTPKGARLRWHRQTGVGAATFGELAHVGQEMTGDEVLSGRFAGMGMVQARYIAPYAIGAVALKLSPHALR